MVSRRVFLLACVTAVTSASQPVQMKFVGVGTSVKDTLTNSTHYEDPKPNGCRADEEAIQIQGVSGDFCTPACLGTTCPSDVPRGCSASPACALQDSSGQKFCALMCDPTSNDGACGPNASCKPISGVGICTYDD